MEPSHGLSPHRWVVVSTSALIMAISMGTIVNGMSAFVVPMQEAYGWLRADISLINVAGIIGLAVGGLVMGPLADRHGARTLVFLGSIVLGLSYLAASLASELWHYYLLIFIAGFFGAAAIFSPVMATVGNWFPVGAGLAIGIASAGQALGQGGVPFLSSILIQRFGIEATLAISGVTMLVLLVPLSLLLRPAPGAADRSQAVGQPTSSDGYPAFNTVVPALSVAVILCCTCMSVPLMHLVPLIQDRGFAAEEASSVIFVMLLAGIVGRVAFGKFSDIVGALPAYMTATFWMTFLVYGFIHVSSLTGFYAFSIIYGFGYAGVMTGVLVSVSSLTPPHRRASALGIVGFFGWLGHANGGYLGGYLFDTVGDYSFAYALAATAGVLNLLIVALLYFHIRGSGGRVLAA